MQNKQKARRAAAVIAACILCIMAITIPIGAEETPDGSDSGINFAESVIDPSFFYSGGRIDPDYIDWESRFFNQILPESIVCITLDADDLNSDKILSVKSEIVTRFNAVILKFDGCNPGWMENEVGQYYHVGKDLTITINGKGYYLNYVGSGRNSGYDDCHITVVKDTTDNETKEFILDQSVRFETLKIYAFSCAWVQTSYDKIVDKLGGTFSFPKAATYGYDQGIIRAKLDLMEERILFLYADEVELQLVDVGVAIATPIKKLTSEAMGDAYSVGKDIGYDEGYSIGHTNGYQAGYAEGDTVGYNAGVRDGRDDAVKSVNMALELIGTIFETPTRLIYTIFNVEMFGINLADLMVFLVAVVLILLVVNLVRRAKS